MAFLTMNLLRIRFHTSPFSSFEMILKINLGHLASFLDNVSGINFTAGNSGAPALRDGLTIAFISAGPRTHSLVSGLSLY